MFLCFDRDKIRLEIALYEIFRLQLRPSEDMLETLQKLSTF
jgi:hypothetical protein